MHIGQLLRYKKYKTKDGKPPHRPRKIDGYENYYFHVYSDAEYKAELPVPQLEKGINGVRKYRVNSVWRRPAILISSSPNKSGSSVTPWEDIFEPDHGYVYYFGDNKRSGDPAEQSPGNKVLLREFDLHRSSSRDDRLLATPIWLFRRTENTKGIVAFQGIGLLDSAERVTQFNQDSGEYFTNYRFGFCVVSLAKESEDISYQCWTRARREQTLEESLAKACSAWRTWVDEGPKSLEKVRRRVYSKRIKSKEEQKPKVGTKQDKALKQIYDKFSQDNESKKHFEAVAERVSEHILKANGADYKFGWITNGSSDGGVDYVARVTWRSLFPTHIIVLGQAKCEKLDQPTGGTHVARTVARLKRGWVGVYVTTSYFSEKVQQEIYGDSYPLVMVSGKVVAEQLLQICQEEGFSELDDLLNDIIKSERNLNRKKRRPEEILREP